MELTSDKVKIKDILAWKRGNILRINAEYQRGAVWKDVQQKKLIDSVLRGYPLPLIYLHYKKEIVGGITREDFEIIDGQQRINALYYFGEGALTLFDPVKDDRIARFPKFIKDMPCPWGGRNYENLAAELRDKFDNTELFIVKVTTHNEDEARDLFIRLQAGLPLNAQEKRDAWPGGYTEFVLKYGGKKELIKYPGHEFFRKLILAPSTDRGQTRTLCAQIGMLFFEEATKGKWLSIGTTPIDDYYYQNLSFNIYSEKVARFGKVLQLATDMFSGYKGPKFKAHDAIHIVLLIDSLMDDYTTGWQTKFVEAFDAFRHRSAIDTKAKSGEYWLQYGALTMTQAAAAATIQARHEFFSRKMLETLQPLRKDPTRIYGQVEREILYFQYRKQCVVCNGDLNWDDMEIHHLSQHQHGGQTILENGVPVHKLCHPKGKEADDFERLWNERNEKVTYETVKTDNGIFAGEYYILENVNKGILAYAKTVEGNKLCVLAGSTVARTVSDNFAATSPIPSNKRIKFYREGIINENNTFTQDVVFNSKSGAACLILGQSANGNLLWKPTNSLSQE